MLAFPCLVSALLLSACASKEASKPQCATDPDCGTGVCMMGTCLPRGNPRTVAIEILPRTDSTSARTGIARVALGPAQIELAADDRVAIDGTVTNGPAAHVVLSTPGPIPGQADLQFETELAESRFQLGLGRSLLAGASTIWLFPTAKTQELPPVRFAATLDPALNLTFPASADMVMVRAALRNSLDLAPGMYAARAFAGNQVVSNAVMTDETGLFQLLIAPGVVPAEAGGMISVEFTALDPAEAGLRFITPPFSLASTTGGTKPRTFRMPAFVTPAPLRFTVLKGATIAGAVADMVADAIPDVTVRFRTEIAAPVDGVAIYEREQRTDGLGQVEVPLIPGTATDPRMYQITILPPPDSGYAGRCVPEHPVTIVGNAGEPRYSTTFSLDPKVKLKGILTGGDGSPAAGVAITATFLRGNTLCLNPAFTSPVSNTTARDGSYEMLVDPGTYQLDIDPPAGAPLPRLTKAGEDALVVMGDTTHDVVLPAGEAVDGHVLGADGLDLATAGIKVFQVLCEGDTCQGPARIPPALRSQTHTDTKGQFRAVLPLSL